MEDNHTKFELFVKLGKLVFIVFLALIIVFIGYRVYMKKLNTDKFYDCLKSNNMLPSKIEDNDKNDMEYSTFDNTEYLLVKSINENDGNRNMDIVLYYNKDNNSIRGELSMQGKNKANNFGIYLIYGDYNIKADKYDCQIDQDDGFSSRCNILLKESKKFSKDVEQLSKSCNVNLKYVSKESINKKIGLVKE